MIEDGPLERGIMPRLEGGEIPVGSLGFPGQEGRQDVAPLVCSPLEDLELRFNVVVRSHLGRPLRRGGVGRFPTELLGHPDHTPPQYVDLLVPRCGLFGWLHPGSVLG